MNPCPICNSPRTIVQEYRGTEGTFQELYCKTCMKAETRYTPDSRADRYTWEPGDVVVTTPPEGETNGDS